MLVHTANASNSVACLHCVSSSKIFRKITHRIVCECDNFYSNSEIVWNFKIKKPPKWYLRSKGEIFSKIKHRMIRDFDGIVLNSETVQYFISKKPSKHYGWLKDEIFQKITHRIVRECDNFYSNSEIVWNFKVEKPPKWYLWSKGEIFSKIKHRIVSDFVNSHLNSVIVWYFENHRPSRWHELLRLVVFFVYFWILLLWMEIQAKYFSNIVLVNLRVKHVNWHVLNIDLFTQTHSLCHQAGGEWNRIQLLMSWSVLLNRIDHRFQFAERNGSIS